MESAASRPRFFALLPPVEALSAARCVAAGGVVTFAALGAPLHAASQWRFAALLWAFLSMWWHLLEGSGLPRPGIALAMSLLAWQLRAAPSSLYDSVSLAGGLFVYLVVWVLAAYERRPGLQAMASAALLLSGGVQARSGIAIACAVLSLALFLLHVRSNANPLGFGLLLFTPALLCTLGASLFALLTANALTARPLLAIPATAVPEPSHLWRYLFFFPLAVIVFRIGCGCFRSPDIAYLAMLAIGSVLCVLHWPRDAMDLGDLFFAAAGGAAALLSASGTPSGAESSPAMADPPRSG